MKAEREGDVEARLGDWLERRRVEDVAYLTFALEHPHLYAAISGPELGSGKRYPALYAARVRVFGHLRAAIVACQRDGIVREGSAEEHTLFCWSAVHGLASLVADGLLDVLDLPADEKKLGDIVIDRVFVGLAAVPI